MNYKLLKRIGINEPSDGYTPDEEKIAELLADHTVQSLYAKLPNNRMKFIVATHFELGYPQDLVADMLGISQPSLSDQIALIQKVFLGKPYNSRNKPNKFKNKSIKSEDMFKFLVALSEE